MQSQTINPPSSTTSRDETTLRDLIAAQAEAWNHGDAAAWCAAFTDDASFISVRGDLLTGREQMVARHRIIFAGVYKGSHSSIRIESVKLLAPGVALIESVHEVTGFGALPPGVTPTEPGKLLTRMKYVAVKRGETWQFVAAQNTATLPGMLGPTGTGAPKP